MTNEWRSGSADTRRDVNTAAVGVAVVDLVGVRAVRSAGSRMLEVPASLHPDNDGNAVAAAVAALHNAGRCRRCERSLLPGRVD